jgi:hypothetical protein
MYTTWGKDDTITRISDGIVEVSTPSHGGFILSEARMKAMPEHLKACSWTKDNNFEEDCSWCAVVLAWPQYFDAKRIDAAQKTYDMVYGKNRRAA